MDQQQGDPKMAAEARLHAELERIIEDLSRLRERLDALDLEWTPIQHELTNHLTLASVAALRLRFMPDDTSPLDS
jgi:hypothetical protein